MVSVSEWPTSIVGNHVLQRIEKVKVEQDREYDTMGVRWYGNGAYLRTPSRPKTKTLNRAREGDFVFCRIDAQNGPFAVVSADLDGALVSNEFPLYSTDGATLDAQFLVLCFLRSSTRAQIGGLREGRDGRARWKETDFESWEIPCPPLEIQRKIVEVISAIDETVTALGAEVAAAEVARAALLNKLLTADAEWEWTTLGHVATWTSGATPIAINRSFYEGGTVPWAVISDVKNEPISKTARGLTNSGLAAIGGAKKLAPVGSVLVTMYGTVGRTAVVKTQMATNQAIARGVPGHKVTSEYLFNWIRGNQVALNDLAEGKTQQNISKHKIENFSIAVPPHLKQDRICETISAVDEHISALKAEFSHLQVTRAALLDSLLTRQVEVSL